MFIYIQKSRHSVKSKAICVNFLWTITRNFTLRKISWDFEIDIYIKNHDTLRYVTFLFSKSQTLRKIKTISVTFLNFTIFHWIFEIDRGGRNFYICKKAFTMRYIIICKKMHFLLRFLYKNPDTSRYISICTKKSLWV